MNNSKINATSKIDGLLNMHKESFSSYSRFMNVSPQATNKKSKNQTWNINDLLSIANLTNSKLAFIDEDNKPIIIFDQSDLKPKE